MTATDKHLEERINRFINGKMAKYPDIDKSLKTSSAATKDREPQNNTWHLIKSMLVTQKATSARGY